MKHWATRVASACALLVLAGWPARADLEEAKKAYAELLTRYVTPRGVRYDSWRSSGEDLKKISEITMLFRSTDPAPLEPDQRKALYINLFNAKVLELVLFANPKHSIRDLSKKLSPNEIFGRPTVNFDNKIISLNELEKRLRQEFKDPRMHFAMNRAARSSPPLRTEVFLGPTLDAQLDDAVRSYLALPESLDVRREGGRVRIVAPRIFDWYGDDFKASGGVLAFIAKYGPEDAAAAAAEKGTKLEFADFDWGLNGAR